MEGVAAGLDERRHHDAAQRHLGVRTNGLHPGLFDRCVVEVIAGHAGFPRCREDALQRLPRLTRLAECTERDAVGAGRTATDIDRVSHAWRLSEQRKETDATGRRGFQHLGRQSGAGARRRDVHDGGGARHQDRLFQCTDLHHDVDLGDESARQSQPFAPNRLEARQVVTDFIRANRQRRQPVFSTAVGEARHLRHLERGTLGSHRDAREYGATLICHLTDDPRGVLARGGASGGSQKRD